MKDPPAIEKRMAGGFYELFIGKLQFIVLFHGRKTFPRGEGGSP